MSDKITTNYNEFKEYAFKNKKNTPAIQKRVFDFFYPNNEKIALVKKVLKKITEDDSVFMNFDNEIKKIKYDLTKDYQSRSHYGYRGNRTTNLREELLNKICKTIEVNRKEYFYSTNLYRNFESEDTVRYDSFFYDFSKKSNELKEKNAENESELLDNLKNEYLNKYIEMYKDEVTNVFGFKYLDLIEYIVENDLEEKIFKSLNLKNMKALDMDNDERNEYIKNNAMTYQEKEKDIHCFDDFTFLITHKDHSLELIHPMHSEMFFSKLNVKQYEYKFRKTPFLLKGLMNHLADKDIGFFENNKKNFDEIDLFYDAIVKNREIIKEYNFDLIKSLDDHKNLEYVMDDIQKLKIKIKARSRLKSFLSKKTMHLLTDDNIKVFIKLNEKKVSNEKLQSELFNSVASFEVSKNSTPDEISNQQEMFHNTLLVVKNKILNNFDVQYYLNEMKKNGHFENVLYQENDKILYHVKTAEESNIYGNQTWCISRENSYKLYFEEYTENNKRQYFFYDFRAENTSEALLGITMEDNGEINVIFDNNNKVYENEEEIEKIKELINKNDPYFIEKNKKEKKLKSKRIK